MKWSSVVERRRGFATSREHRRRTKNRTNATFLIYTCRYNSRFNVSVSVPGPFSTTGACLGLPPTDSNDAGTDNSSSSSRGPSRDVRQRRALCPKANNTLPSCLPKKRAYQTLRVIDASLPCPFDSTVVSEQLGRFSHPSRHEIRQTATQPMMIRREVGQARRRAWGPMKSKLLREPRCAPKQDQNVTFD
jgi:hypothetical protein